MLGFDPGPQVESRDTLSLLFLINAGQAHIEVVDDFKYPFGQLLLRQVLEQNSPNSEVRLLFLILMNIIKYQTFTCVNQLSLT